MKPSFITFIILKITIFIFKHVETRIKYFIACIQNRQRTLKRHFLNVITYLDDVPMSSTSPPYCPRNS